LCETCEAKQLHPADHILLKAKLPLRSGCRRGLFTAPGARCPALIRSRSLNTTPATATATEAASEGLGLGLSAGTQAGAVAKDDKPAVSTTPVAAEGKTVAAAVTSSPGKPSWRNAFGAFLGKAAHASAQQAAAVAKDGAHKADYVADVTIPDGVPQQVKSVITKTWAVKNSGTAAWPEGTQLLFVGGTLAPATVAADKGVTVPLAKTGETVNISVQVKIPEKEGRYTGYYRLATADGKRFGSRVWIDVLALTSPAPAATVAVTATPAAAVAAVKTETKASEPKPTENSVNAVKYAAQLAKLRRMGFKDDGMLLDLLCCSSGNEQQVIDWLVQPVGASI